MSKAEEGMVTLYGTNPSMESVGLIGCRGLGPEELAKLVDQARRQGLFAGTLTHVDGEVDPHTYNTASVEFHPPAPLGAAAVFGVLVAAEVGARTIGKIQLSDAA